MQPRETLRWGLERQRNALQLLSQHGFLQSREFHELLGQFSAFHVPGARAMARRMGYPLDRQEVQNLMITHLLHSASYDDGVLHRAAQAEDPWAYLGACLAGWLRQEHGHRAAPLPQDSVLHPPFVPDDETLTPIETVIELVQQTLQPRTPERLCAELPPLLQFLAMNPAQRRSYEHEERAHAVALFRAFTEPQIAQVMHLCWGTRPQRAATSLMAKFLTDPAFVPERSPAHAKALSGYTRKMRVLEGEARTLQLWGVSP